MVLVGKPPIDNVNKDDNLEERLFEKLGDATLKLPDLVGL